MALIKIMISSRCRDPFPVGGDELSVLRRELKRRLEGVRLFGKPLFEVWINEDAPPAPLTTDSVDKCLKEVDAADIVISLSNGNAGWATTSADIGICHAELMRAVATAPHKVRLVDLGNVSLDGTDQGRRNERFQEYLADQNYFRGGTVTSVADALVRVEEAVFDALITLTQNGVMRGRGRAGYLGEALEWSNLDFTERSRRIVGALRDAVADRPSAKPDGDTVTIEVAGRPILFILHAVPAAFSVPAAREMIGRPFLRDHEYWGRLSIAEGPVHMVGCLQGVTQTQATALLGNPNATIIDAPFGIHVVDNIQKIQFVLLRQCRDLTTTRYNVQRFFDWLRQSGMERQLAIFAASRKKIIKAIKEEN